MTRVVVTEHAKRDVREIISDLNQRAGYLVASRYASDFKAAYRNLADFPKSGPVRPALGTAARVKFVYPYVIIYDCDADAVTVLRVLHGRRDISVDLIRRRQSQSQSGKL
jgi:toxin ParE1/3/4